MQDRCGRTITYMRISLTDRCNLSCSYCRPEHAECFRHEEILSYEEILRLCRLAVKLGIDRFKVTGGEPFVRKGVIDFIGRLKKLSGTKQVTVTTNGTLIETYLPDLAGIGVDGINISLDTTDREKYRNITGKDALQTVLAAVQSAERMGMNVKLNAVLTEQTGEKDILGLLEMIRDRRIALRFIEQMPFSGMRANGMTGEQVRELLRQKGYMLTKLPAGSISGNGPAVYYRVAGMQGCLGMIEALHGKFCESCNRVRLTSIGQLKPCLYDPHTTDLREALRNGRTDEEIILLMRETIYGKPREHCFEQNTVQSSMSRIGG